MTFMPLILTHVVAATGALLLGGVMLMLKKGTATHRMIGRIWVALMFLAALASFGIQTKGHYSWIHLLSAWIIFLLCMSMYSIVKQHNVGRHRRLMVGAYIGLVTAGVFSFRPNRLLGELARHTLGLVT